MGRETTNVKAHAGSCTVEADNDDLFETEAEAAIHVLRSKPLNDTTAPLLSFMRPHIGMAGRDDGYYKIKLKSGYALEPTILMPYDLEHSAYLALTRQSVQLVFNPNKHELRVCSDEADEMYTPDPCIRTLGAACDFIDVFFEPHTALTPIYLRDEAVSSSLVDTVISKLNTRDIDLAEYTDAGMLEVVLEMLVDTDGVDLAGYSNTRHNFAVGDVVQSPLITTTVKILKQIVNR